MKTLVVVSTLVAAAAVVLVALVLSAGNRTSWTDLVVGDCFDLAGAVDDADGDLAAVFVVDRLDCSEPHDAEVVASGMLDPDGVRGYPSDDELFAETDAACVRVAIDQRFAMLPIVPDQATWEGRRGHYACVAVVIGGGTVSVRANP